MRSRKVATLSIQIKRQLFSVNAGTRVYRHRPVLAIADIAALVLAAALGMSAARYLYPVSMPKLTSRILVSWIVLASVLGVACAGPLVILSQRFLGGRRSKLSDAEWLWAAQIFTVAGLFPIFRGHFIFIPILSSGSLLCLILSAHIIKWGSLCGVKSGAHNTWTST